MSVLLSDWAYFPPDKPTDCLRPVRAVCTAWRNIIDADIQQLTVTVPSIRPACLAENFPNATHLDLSRYHHNSQDVFAVLEQLKLRYGQQRQPAFTSSFPAPLPVSRFPLTQHTHMHGSWRKFESASSHSPPAAAAACRSLVLADPWNPPVSIPTQFLQDLTYLGFLADGLLVTHLASQFCEALVRLKQLRELQLSRLQLSASAAQMLAQALTELPHLNRVVLSGGATPMHMAELYVLLNGEDRLSAQHKVHSGWLEKAAVYAAAYKAVGEE